MGCGTVKQFPVYQKDDYPECVNMTFELEENDIPFDSIHFDDNDILKGFKAFQISSFSVSMGDYIVGIAISYKSNGKEKSVEHMGKDVVIDSEKIYLDPFEHIEFIKCTYSQKGVHSIEVKTNTTRSINAVGNKGIGEKTRELSLKDYDKAVIGFRGCFKGSIYDLYVYVAERLDILIDANEEPQQQIAEDAEREHDVALVGPS